ncbi:MAG: NADH-ubiquinone oxidoreductase-F iron-sulfur binding region domain-containing protein [Acidimicrobiales bacterium]|nr:NADH-ubiquinone oxidoreductase-F iron-sulfur binding region domain-containing protein [Acidimicrobiales bacterium]
MAEVVVDRPRGLMTGFLLPPTPIASIEDYLATSGGRGLARAVELGPAATIEELTRSGLRGRGGGGFPTGQKWAGVAAQTGTHRYVVCNAAEGEPGTFKDRSLLRANPYQLVEGLVIAAFAVGATEAFVGLKASFTQERERLTNAVVELQQAGVCGDCQVTIVAGPEEYLFGEEKAMLEVIEGGDPLPRLFPPYEHGLFATAPQTGWQATESGPGHGHRHESNPTLVNNAETLSNVPHILARGADWFRTMGTTEAPGTVVATVVGDVVRPGVGEVALGTPLIQVIEDVSGGVAPGRRLKAVLSGVSNAVITAADLDAPFSYGGLSAVGSGLGAAGLIVYDDTACMIEVARMFSRFLYVESCGQCPPCKRGSGEITAGLARLERGEATTHDLDEIAGWLDKVTDGNRCYLAVEERVVVSSILRAFPEEVVAHLEGSCPRPRRLPIPKIVDLADGQVTYDERQWRKQPDWTYSEADDADPGQLRPQA